MNTAALAGRVCSHPNCWKHGVEFDLSTGRVWCKDHQHKEAQRGQEVKEGTRKEERQEAESVRQGAAVREERVLKWREVRRVADPYRQPDYFELYVEASPVERDYYASVALSPRPNYCDRGHWIATVDGIHTIDAADAFPRYYMDFDRAKLECEAWLMWRLSRPS